VHGEWVEAAFGLMVPFQYEQAMWNEKRAYRVPWVKEARCYREWSDEGA